MTYTLWRCIGFSSVIVVLHIVVETIYIMAWRTFDGTPALSNKRSRYYLNNFISTAQAVLGLAQRSCPPAAFSTMQLVPLCRYSKHLTVYNNPHITAVIIF